MKKRAFAVLVIFVLALSACEEPGPSFDNSVLLTVDVPYGDSIAGEGVITYRFVADGSVVHNIALEDTDSDVSWELYDSGHVFIMECDNEWIGDEINDTPVLAGGETYYVVVYEWDDVANTFTLTVTTP